MGTNNGRTSTRERQFAGTGEMAERSRQFNWATTPLGAIAKWPEALLITVNTLLCSRQPMFLWWGPDLIQFYNDAYRQSLGPDKHPAALGQSARAFWPEIWSIIGPQIEAVMTGGIATWHEDQLVPIYRSGRLEDVYWTYGYSPVRNVDGDILGVLVTCTETTRRILAEQQLRLFIEHAPASIAMFDRNMNYLAVSRRWVTEHGQMEDPVGRNHYEVFPSIPERWRQAHRQGLSGAVLSEDQDPVVREDGSTQWINWKIHPWMMKDGEVGGIMLAKEDVTSWVKTAEAIRESERQLTVFADTIPTLAWMAAGDGSIFWYNHRWFEYTGTTQKEMEGWGWQSVHDPDVLPAVMERWSNSISTGQPFEMVFPLKGADGVFRSFLTRIVPVRNQHGDIIRWFGTNTDVDELRRTRESLALEQRRLATLLDNVPTGIVFADAEGRVIMGNSQAETIFRHPVVLSPDIAGYSEWIAFHPDGRRVEPQEFPLSRTLTDGRPYRGEYRYRRGDGTISWIEFASAPIRDEKGKLTGGVCAATDIDARKRSEEALIRSEKLAVVGRLAATISHEINNPLESVTNLLYLMDAQNDLQTIRRYAHDAQRELARVSHIVTHTLQFNRQSTIATREKLSSLIESALAIYEGRIKQSGVQLRRDYAEDDSVLCFGSELRQVFANLIGNAFDATRKGGTVVLRTRSQTSWRTGEPGVTAAIGDTGEGMTADTLKRLFEPFFSTKGNNGTGLGLWVSREILMRHHAVLRVRSRRTAEQSGTVFLIWFPITTLPGTTQNNSGIDTH